MYAIVEINGQQFKAEEGKKLFVHHIKDVEAGKTVEFDKVLLVDKDGAITVGAPTVEGAKVVVEVVNPLVKGDRSKADSSGLDYSKTVLIRPEDYDKYLIENAVVDTDEYKAVRINIYKIEKQISKYIEGYVKSVSDFENADKKSFERKYKYSTLKYFHDILGIE